MTGMNALKKELEVCRINKIKIKKEISVKKIPITVFIRKSNKQE
jgi:hypothetical protein